jgi:sulfatase modifying factor 1
MKYLKPILLTAGALVSACSAFASIEIGTSYVGDINNTADSTGYGAVSYGYHVGTYEVTNSQYVSFLNAKAATNTHALYYAQMGFAPHGGINQSGTSGTFSYSVKSGFGNKPVNYVDFWQAARFTNWLTNGQGSSSTETGVYTLNDETNPTNGTVTRNSTAWDEGGVAIASEDEWYKAAYYQPEGAGGDSDNYWLYPTASNSITTDDANYANDVGTVTVVGTYSDDPSYYGTFDQGGNVWEWNDTIVSSDNRGLRGGAYNFSANVLQSSLRNEFLATDQGNNTGFRVSSLAPIPEPSSYAAMFGCLVLGYAIIRRKERRTL